MSYKEIGSTFGGIQWPCYDEALPAKCTCNSRLWQEPLIGPRAPFHAVEFEPPVEN